MKPHQLLTLDNVLPHLRKARITKHSFPRKAIACCPAHDDKHPSLSLSEAPDGKLLWKCHAGCSQEAVYEKLKELVGIKPATAKLIQPSKKNPTTSNLLLLNQQHPQNHSRWKCSLKINGYPQRNSTIGIFGKYPIKIRVRKSQYTISRGKRV